MSDYNKSWIIDGFMDGRQPVTKEQYIKYVEGSLNEIFTKFRKFSVLVNPRNNFSEEFIKEHKRDFNQVSFFNTEQVKELLAFIDEPISENALKLFKTKIDYVHLLNNLSYPKLLDKMVKVCKKELFNVLIKDSDKLNKQSNLDYLKKIM